MIVTKITGVCVYCNKMYQLNHSASKEPSNHQIKSLQSSERCPDCSETHLRTVLNFHWTGTKSGSIGQRSVSDFSYNWSGLPTKNKSSIENKIKERVCFIDCFPVSEKQLVNVLKGIKTDMGLRLQDSCDAVAIALYESLHEGSVNIVTDKKNNWIHMVFQLGNHYFDLDGKYSKEKLLHRCNNALIKKIYFIKPISYEDAYDLMDWRIEEEKNYLKDELYKRVSEISELDSEHNNKIIAML